MSKTYAMKKHHPGGSSHGYYWEDEDSIVLVDEDHVEDLERTSHGDIYQVNPSELPPAVDDDEDEQVEFHQSPLLETGISAVSDLADANDIASVTKPVTTPRKRAAAAK